MRARQICGSGGSFDGGNLIGVHLTVFVANGNIFAGPECMRAEPIAALVVVLRGLVIIEDPAHVLGPARPVHQETVLVGLTIPEPPHAAMVAVLLPEPCIDMVPGIERRHEFIAMPRRALRELLRAGEVEPDALERVWQGGHG